MGGHARHPEMNARRALWVFDCENHDPFFFGGVPEGFLYFGADSGLATRCCAFAGAVLLPVLCGRRRIQVLNRNDARVAAVWMDEYTDLFYRLRGLEGIDLGPKIEVFWTWV